MMPWIVKNLWLIPALPILAAGLSAPAHSLGAERRQTVAHGASRGLGVQNTISPGGAKESWPTHLPISFLKKHEIEYDEKYLWE
jgi:hypothetical protein